MKRICTALAAALSPGGCAVGDRAAAPATPLSVNPARGPDPSLLVGGAALGQFWLFIVAPLIGAAVAGFLFRGKVLSTEDWSPRRPPHAR